MNWLRLDGFDVGDPRLVHDEKGELVEVQVDCTPNKFDVDLCCLALKLVKNGTKVVRYRDLKIEAAPTWLHVSRQRYRCQSCDSTLYQGVPHVDEKHMMTTRLREAIELASIKRTFRDTVAVLGVEETLARRVFRAHADHMLLRYRYKAPRVLGIDENSLLGDLRGVIVDVENAKLLDVYEGRTQSDIRRGFDRMEDWDNERMARAAAGVLFVDRVPDCDSPSAAPFERPVDWVDISQQDRTLAIRAVRAALASAREPGHSVAVATAHEQPTSAADMALTGAMAWQAGVDAALAE